MPSACIVPRLRTARDCLCRHTSPLALLQERRHSDASVKRTGPRSLSAIVPRRWFSYSGPTSAVFREKFSARDVRDKTDIIVAEPRFEATRMRPDPKTAVAVSSGTQPSFLSLSASQQYGKWASLSRDVGRLEVESSFGRTSPSRLCLVDQPENENDIELWACLLNFAHRTSGDDGVSRIWQAVRARKKLWNVEGPTGIYFWRTIVESVVKNEDALHDLWQYAEWMHKSHRAVWPSLYTTAISHMLQHGQHDRALEWHTRLATRFTPDQHAFGVLMKQFVLNSDVTLQRTLRSLYTSNTHRELYDVLIPYLFHSGQSMLASEWRSVLIKYGDSPIHPTISQPYLRFLSTYSSHTELSAAETAVLNFGPVSGRQVSFDIKLRERMNRIIGGAFGIREKPYNDSIGARWFASSWVTLDFAIAAVHTLGVREIGPLSLQSIALREMNARAIAYRIEQIRRLDIGLGKSAFTNALTRFAENGQETDLQELLRSDIHPDVFDNPETCKEILLSSATRGEWKTYRLLLAVQLSLTKTMASATANAILSDALKSSNDPVALRMLDDMHAMDVTLSNGTSLIMPVLPFHDPDGPIQSGYDMTTRELAFYRRGMTLGATIPLKIARGLLFSLGSQYRLSELEALSLELIGKFKSAPGMGESMVSVHQDDVPGQSPEPSLQRIPTDLPLRDRHPVATVFDDKLQKFIISCGFIWGLHPLNDLSTSSLPLANPEEYSIARGVRFLRVLKDHSVSVKSELVRNCVVTQVAQLYTDDHTLVSPRSGKKISMEWIHDKVLAAWGGPLFSSVSELRARAEAAAAANNIAREEHGLPSDSNSKRGLWALTYQRGMKSEGDIGI